MVERDKEGEFLEWFRPLARQLGGGFRNPRISAMREAGGVDYRQADAQSIAFQVEFDSIAEARLWSVGVFADVAAAFEERFAPQAMVFVSLFEILEF